MHDTRALLEKSTGSFPRAKATAQRLRTRAQRCAERSPPPPLEHALAFKRYLCLLLEEGKVARHQLTLRSDLSDDARAGVMGLFHGARVMAFAVDRTTVLLAAGVPMSRAFAEFARGHGVLGRKLHARLKEEGATRPLLSPDEQQRMILLERALAVVTRVDLPPRRAFAAAGFDLATIYSSPQSP